MTNLLGKLTGAALHLLFPLHCLGCREEGKLLCATCIIELLRLSTPCCAGCGQPGPEKRCHRCAEMPLAVDGIRSVFLMGGVVRTAVYSLKYQNIRAAAPELGQLLAQYLDSHPIPAEVIVLVPLHPSRLRSRGYNQSVLLTREVGRLTGLPACR